MFTIHLVCLKLCQCCYFNITESAQGLTRHLASESRRCFFSVAHLLSDCNFSRSFALHMKGRTVFHQKNMQIKWWIWKYSVIANYSCRINCRHCCPVLHIKAFSQYWNEMTTYGKKRKYFQSLFNFCNWKMAPTAKIILQKTRRSEYLNYLLCKSRPS